jgi:hypothetical protein
MTLNEFILSIKSSKSSAALVDVRPFESASGYIRKICIDWSNKIVIGFHPSESGLGGPVFWGNYTSLEMAVRGLEGYLGNRIENWPSESRPFPTYHNLSDAEIDNSDMIMAKAIQSDSIPLPAPTFVLHSADWRYCLEFFTAHRPFFDSVLDKPDSYAEMQNFARALSKSGKSRAEIMGIFSAAHSYCLRRNLPEDIIADVMDGITNSFGKGNPNNLDLP